MRLSPRPAPPVRDTTAALMDIVFLMLIFFLLAGTVAPPEDRTVTLAESVALDSAPAQRLIYIRADGTLQRDGNIIAPDTLAQTLIAEQSDKRVRIGADRDLPAQILIDILSTLRTHGIVDITLITQRAER